MTFPELVTMAEGWIDDEFDNIQFRDWFQMCQDNELAEHLYLPTEVVIARVDNNFPLPSNYKEMIEILNSEYLGDYEIFGDNIIVSETNSVTEITLRYDRYPTRFTTDVDFVPDIPEWHHVLYAQYAGMMGQINDDESERYAVMKDAYSRGLSTLIEQMLTKKKSQKKVRQWKVVR